MYKRQFYIPVDLKNIKCSKNTKYGVNWAEVLLNLTIITNELYHECLKDAEKQLGRKRAKESARFFNMYNSQIQADVSFNMRSFANFLKLRNSEHAQKEIREIANEMKTLVENIPNNPFKETMKNIVKS